MVPRSPLPSSPPAFFPRTSLLHFSGASPDLHFLTRLLGPFLGDQFQPFYSPRFYSSSPFFVSSPRFPFDVTGPKVVRDFGFECPPFSFSPIPVFLRVNRPNAFSFSFCLSESQPHGIPFFLAHLVDGVKKVFSPLWLPVSSR